MISKASRSRRSSGKRPGRGGWTISSGWSCEPMVIPKPGEGVVNEEYACRETCLTGSKSPRAWRDTSRSSGGGRHLGRYDFTWLRDNCFCSGCRHPANGHRLIESWKIPPDITPYALSVDEAGRFCIIFPNSTEAWQNE